jgi:hypothetical protein
LSNKLFARVVSRYGVQTCIIYIFITFSQMINDNIFWFRWIIVVQFLNLYLLLPDLGKKNIIIMIHQNVSILVHTTPLGNNLRITYASSQIIGNPDNLKVYQCKKTRRPTPQAHMAQNIPPLFLLIFLLTYLFSITCLLFHLFFLSDTNTINKGKSYEIIKILLKIIMQTES